MVHAMSERTEPAYLRLGRSELDDERGLPPYAPWRRLQDGQAGVIVVVGPIAGGLWRASRDLPSRRRPALWVVSELGGQRASMAPPETPPEALLDAIANAPALGVAEEHIAHGGFGERFLYSLALARAHLPPVVHAHAHRLPFRTLRLAELASARMRARRLPRFCCVWPNAPRRRRGAVAHEYDRFTGARAQWPDSDPGSERLRRRQSDARALRGARGCVRDRLAGPRVAALEGRRRPPHHGRPARAGQHRHAAGPPRAAHRVRLRRLRRLLVRAGRGADVPDQRGVQAGADRAAIAARHSLLHSRRQLIGIRRALGGSG